jgi:hypothetical protein
MPIPRSHTLLSAPRQVKEEGVYLLGKKERSNLDISGRPKTGAYLGVRLVPRRRATAREIDEQVRALF